MAKFQVLLPYSFSVFVTKIFELKVKIYSSTDNLGKPFLLNRAWISKANLR